MYRQRFCSLANRLAREDGRPGLAQQSGREDDPAAFAPTTCACHAGQLSSVLTNMARWEIVAVKSRNIDGTHTHVSEVWMADGVADEDRSEAAFEAIKKIRRKRDTYFTIGVASGEESMVEIIECPVCGADRLATFPSDPSDDDLDHFPEPGEHEPPRTYGFKIREVKPPRPKRKPPDPRSR